MMSGFYSGGMMSFWFGFRALFCFLVLFGAVAALIWLARFAKREFLMKVIVFTLLIGILGGILSSLLMWRGFGYTGIMGSFKDRAQFMRELRGQ